MTWSKEEICDMSKEAIFTRPVGTTWKHTEELGKASGARSEGVLVLGTALGPAQVGRESHASALLHQVLDGLHRRADACSTPIISPT